MNRNKPSGPGSIRSAKSRKSTATGKSSERRYQDYLSSHQRDLDEIARCLEEAKEEQEGHFKPATGRFPRGAT